MSVTLTINNFSSGNILETAELNADALAAATALTLVNNNSIVLNDYIVIGTLGNEGSELRQVSGATGATGLTVPALSFNHLRFDKVTKLFGNSITVYRAPNVNGLQPADSAFAVFASNTIAIDIDQPSTTFTDATGSSDYWYKYVYTNTTTAASTSLADSSAARGSGYGSYCSIDAIREEAGFTRAKYITDAMIDVKRQAAQAAINSALIGIYVLPFTAPINALIEDITRRLAAGWLLLEQYGHYDTKDTNNGQSKVDGVMNAKKTGDLDKLAAGTLVLVGTDGSSQVSPNSANGFSGWPTDETANLTSVDGGGDVMFKIGEVRNSERAY